MKRADLWSMVKETASDWSDDNAARLAAALAYYTLLSLAPLVVIAVTVAGFAFGDEAARGHVAAELRAVVGPGAADGVQTVIESAKSPDSRLFGSIVGVVVLLVGASGVFGELQSALDTIWEVEPKSGRGILGIIKDRFFSFTMVMGVAFLLLVSLVVSAGLAALGHRFESALPGGEVVWQVLNLVISLGVLTMLFALIFKVVPDVEIQWKDVWVGAGVTALLFAIGKFLLGLYLGKSALASSYGAAGSLVALVVWVYYAAQILFLGAEFTQVYARRRGAQIKPTDKARSLVEGNQPGEAAATR